jgi:hypothetical protein
VCTAIGTYIFLDVVVADFAKIRINIHFSAAMRTNGFADGLSALGTKHCIRLVDGTTEGTCLADCLLLGLLLLHGGTRSDWLFRTV